MQFWATVLLDGLTYASYLFIVSLGLTIIFGVMKILNVAHGSFYAWGAYTAAFAIGFITDNDLSEALFLPAILISAILVGVVLGYIIERFILRKMYNQDIHLIVLATFGVFLIFEDLIIITFGVDPYLPYQPAMMLGWVDIVGLGRMVLSYWNLPADTLEQGVMHRKVICRTFSDCTTAPRNGMISGCFPLDPYYKQTEEAGRLKGLKRTST